jgi:CRP-like cAMP-binding protein
MDRIAFLRRVPLFKDLRNDALEALADAIRPQSYPPETNIVEIGEPGHSLFLILEGAVQVLYPARSADFELARLTEGDFFGEMAILNSMPRSATVRSVDSVKVMVLEKEDFQKILTESPARAEGPAPPVTPSAWPRRRPTWWTTSSPMCRCARLSSPFLNA